MLVVSHGVSPGKLIGSGSAHPRANAGSDNSTKNRDRGSLLDRKELAPPQMTIEGHWWVIGKLEIRVLPFPEASENLDARHANGAWSLTIVGDDFGLNNADRLVEVVIKVVAIRH